MGGKVRVTRINSGAKMILNVRIACSEALRQWVCGGTSWSFDVLLRRYALTTSGHVLSITYILGEIPHSCRNMWNFDFLLSCSSIDFLLRGSASILLESWSYTPMT